MRRCLPLVLLSVLSLCWPGGSGSHRIERSLPTSPGLAIESQGIRWPIPEAPAKANAASSRAVPAELPESWLSAVQRGLARREYEATPNPEGLQAPNRAHNLRTYFGPEGVRVMDRTTPQPVELLALRLERVGRSGRMQGVTAGAVRHEGARVEIRRDGVVEWYENSPEGLEQGFTIAARPAGNGPVVVEIAVRGARVYDAGDAATFRSHAGRNLEYGKLLVVDDAGSRLAASMETDEGEVRLVVNDQGAAYPITIDPLLTSSHDTQLVLSQASAWFGHSLAGAGDVNGDGYDDVIVGAAQYDAGQTNEGAAFIFLGSAAGIPTNATPATTLQGNESSAIFAYVGGAGDVNGDGYADVIVGATGLNAYPGGSAHIYHGSAAGIPNGDPGTAETTLWSVTAGNYFGLSVASAGDVNGDGYADVIVGAYGNTGFGAAYVFHGSATGVPDTYALQASTVLTCTQSAAEFGRSVAGAGDLNGDGYADIVVGARNYDSGQSDEGMVFTWHGSATGIPSGNQSSANDNVQSNQISSFFGYSVAGAGDLNGDGYSDIIVGAQGHDGAQADAGAAFTFHGGSGGIRTGAASTVAATTFDPGQLNSRVTCVAGAGDVNGDGYGDIIVGSQWYDVGQTDEGAAFVFLGGPTGAQGATPASAFATLVSNQVDARLGSYVAGAGDVNGDGYADVMAGAYIFDGSQTNEGMARIYLGGLRGVISATPTNAAGVMQSDQTGGGVLGTSPFMGASVAGAGDVNRDGYSDVIVAAPYYDAGESDEGAAFVFLGSGLGAPNGNPANAASVLQSNQASARFGYSVAAAGDVNGDGYGDVIVGATNFDAGETDEGAAFVFLGGAAGVANGDPASAATTLQSNQLGANLGHSVAGAGDVNGDGYADVITGAPWYTSGPTSEGVALVFLGSATGVASGDPFSAATVLQSDQALSGFGVSVAGAGDVNGDGYADVIVGAQNYDLGSNNEGAAFIFPGSSAGIANGNPATAATTLQSDDVDANLGNSVAGAGDVNGDGYADVLVGAYRYGGFDYGAACVFHGSATGVANGTPLTAAVRIIAQFAYTSSSVAGAGDVDGDGYSDIIVGQDFQAPVGNAWIYRGGPAGITIATMQVLAQNQGGAKLGVSVAGAGDVNGDGTADVLVGSVAHDSGEMDEGAAFVFLGGGGRSGRPILPRQARGDGSGVPVQPWGSAASAGFRAGMTAVDPSGRGRARVEVEYCPAGQPFGSGSCVREASATWTEVGAAPGGVALTHDLSVASPGLYHWRARTLHAPYTVTQAGITAPTRPSHGPWRRMQAQTFAADIRILAVSLAVETPREASGISVAPSMNPARGHITLSAVLPGAEAAELELFDVAGRRLLAERLSPGGSGRQSLPVPGDRELSSGVYLIRLSQGGRAATARVVFFR